MRRAIPAVLVWLVASGVVARADMPAVAPGVTVVDDHGRWESAYGEQFYNVVGRVRNGGKASVVFVRLEVEALDGAGKVVAKAEAYNETAEALAEPKANVDEIVRSGTLKPLEAGQEQRFRAGFLQDEHPDIATYRVRVVAAPVAGCASD